MYRTAVLDFLQKSNYCYKDKLANLMQLSRLHNLSTKYNNYHSLHYSESQPKVCEGFILIHRITLKFQFVEFLLIVSQVQFY